MKALFAVLCAIAVVAAKPTSDEVKEKFKNVHEICATSEEDIMKMFKTDSDDPKLKEHMYCILNELVGFEDGKIKKDVFEDLLASYYDDEDKAKEIASECLEDKETPEETSHHIGKCILEHKSKK